MSKPHVALSAAILLMLSGSVPAAEKVLQVIENSYESTTGSVDLPAATSGRISLRPCDVCPLETLSLSASSRYFLARQEVGYAEFRAFVNANSRGLRVHFDPRTKVVTRLVVSG